MPYSALIIGANSTIAVAIADQLMSAKVYDELILVTRAPIASTNLRVHSNVSSFECDYSEASIERIASKLTFKNPSIRLFICNGTLHGDQYFPEKKAEELIEEAMMSLFKANTVVPSLWLKHLLPVISKLTEAKIMLFSARVGSIKDNELGGWYSYRASKAALNMMIKTFSVEYNRRVTQSKLISFHPGMTDTPLSKPFQSRASYTLFTPEFVAKRALNIIESAHCDGKASYVDWDNKSIDW
ncbi:SDR family NAD(P)-dependent oxidoreductase [Marinomonas balearica]|uniref:NAD(P)-dependent dehydrogenase (Short-subunit alcohol dehydrogenase family) n=1 Tax=Marinomonas balearica TaxID=491947 RepID=A0A4R6M9D8_9GAMM|nr:SDR family NAD(P)-dependent oxidoreductase [Marinomonas balearica]TDO98127.1 NAD(P)-dependent dehydrogenase (short-subunit alcohol dehydrogenase family) [Marinomonas balearica]